MKKRLIALLLLLTMAVSLCAVTAAAGEEPVLVAAQNTEETAPEISADTSPAGPNAAVDESEWDTTLSEETRKLLETVTQTAETLDAIAYADVEQQMREGNLTVLTLQESVEMLKSIDYEELYDDLKKQMSQLVSARWGMVQAGSLPEDHPYYMEYDSYAHAQLEQGQEALRDQLKAIRDGDMQQDNASAIRNLRNVQDQVVMGGEMLYATLVALEVQEASLQRQLTSVNRTLEEMQLRYDMGQISAMQLAEVEAGRSALVSGLNTLQMNIRNYKAQFESLLGVEMTGEISLGAVPEVTEKELADMDVERDLLMAKANSYELYEAAKTLEDEQETYKEAGVDYSYDEKKLAFRQAKHTWQAAQYTYNSTLRDYELRFRTLYAQVQDYKQILDAARVSLECEKTGFRAAELKYQQGTISCNTYLTAQDDLRTAEEKVQTAANDLFSAYNTYCWAVQHGILN